MYNLIVIYPNPNLRVAMSSPNANSNKRHTQGSSNVELIPLP
jgi:hypothetical protein